jgi:hypothetical protein
VSALLSSLDSAEFVSSEIVHRSDFQLCFGRIRTGRVASSAALHSSISSSWRLVRLLDPMSLSALDELSDLRLCHLSGQRMSYASTAGSSDVPKDSTGVNTFGQSHNVPVHNR